MIRIILYCMSHLNGKEMQRNEMKAERNNNKLFHSPHLKTNSSLIASHLCPAPTPAALP
jgi:hypothetical protein